MNNMDTEKLYLLLEAAKRERKHDFTVYNIYWEEISSLNLSGKEYVGAVRALCSILEV